MPVSAEPAVSADACVLMDAQTGQVIFAHNAQEKKPMASTTKIMTVLLTLESGALDDTFVVDSDAIRVEGSSMGLQEGDVVTKRALCAGMLLPSGNDAANAAAVRVGGDVPRFLVMMNERAKKIGMTRSCFASPSGLDAEGHGASAYDMALLTREALRNPDFAAICAQQTMTVRYGNPPYARTLTNTNKLLSMDDSVIGVKTGFTDAAGRCLVSAAERGGRRLICVTLNDRNDWEDHEALYDYGFAGAEDFTLPLPERVSVPVEGGDALSVQGYVRTPLTLTAWNGMPPDCKMTVYRAPFLLAPVEKGDQIGEVIVRSGNIEVARLPLISDKTVQLVDNSEGESIIVRTIRWVRCLIDGLQIV
jgi:D-alanyl-D-alanine carboxypeptidase/D-alanyl-D-alanine carboxypeptidase (penicillin-binding protein 5/6)